MCRIAFVFVVLSLLATGDEHAERGAKAESKPEIPDAVTADGKHYSIEMENEYVRVLRIRYGPYEQGRMHNHPRSVTVFLTDGKLRMTMPGGRSVIATVKKGQSVWEEAGPHQPENLTSDPFEAVRTELKSPSAESSAHHR